MSNQEIKRLLFELESELNRHNAPVLRGLKPGKAEIDLRNIFGSLDIPDEIYALLQWKDGTDADNRPIGQSWIFPKGALMSAEKAVRYYQNFVNSDEYWIDGMFPVFESLGGDFYLVDINKSSPTSGFVFYYSRSAVDFETIISKYDSLETLLGSVVECFRTGAYYFADATGFLMSQYLMEREINMKNNPRAAYWTLFK